MGARAGFTGGQLCIDLANLEMSAEQQQELLLAVQTTVVKHLASRAATKIVAITMSPNNGYKPLDEPERPDNDKPYEPDREQPEPDKKPPPPKPESAGRR
jgi:hypothetical protein